jgi:hypothetical protein
MILVEKLIVSQKLMKYKEKKTLIIEGPNLSSIPELLGFGSKNPAVIHVGR